MSKRQEESLEPVLPHNLDAEKFVLAQCMKKEVSLLECSEQLKPEDFYIDKHKVIFLRLCEMKDFGGIDPVMVANSLHAHNKLEAAGGVSYLIDLDKNLPEVVNLEYYIQLIKEKAYMRRLYFITKQAQADVLDQTASSKEVITRIEKQIRVSCFGRDRSFPRRIGEHTAGMTAQEALDPSFTRGVGVYTGYRVLDELTGGIFPSENWVIGAAPGVGKSGVCLQIASFNASRSVPVPVVIFSLEMSEKSLFNRLLCQRAGVTIKRFRSGEAAQNPAERQRLLDAYGELRQLPIFIDDSFALRPSDIDSKMRVMREMNGVGLGIIDFIQKMRPDHARGNTDEKLTEITDSFVGLAKEHCPFVIFSQLSRAHRAAKEKPGLEDLRGSGSLEQVANVALFLYREEMERGKSKDEALRGVAEFLVRKQREGALATIRMKYIGWKMMYEDYPCEHCGQIYFHQPSCPNQLPISCPS